MSPSFFRLIVVIFFLANAVNGNIFKNFKHQLCRWSGCPEKIPATVGSTYRGECRPAPLSDIKTTDPTYPLNYMGYDEHNTSLGFQRGLDTYSGSAPDNLMVYTASINFGGRIELRNRATETQTKWKHLIYVLDLTSYQSNGYPKEKLKLAYYLDGEGVCYTNLDNFGTNADQDPFGTDTKLALILK